MNIGELNRRIELLKYVPKRDEFGGQGGDWQVISRLWGHVSPLRGEERLVREKVRAEMLATVTTRFCSQISVLDRLKHGKKTYEITSVQDENSEHKTMIITVREIENYELQCEKEEDTS